MAAKTWISDAGCDICPAVEFISHIALYKNSQWIWQKLGFYQIVARSGDISV
jgi:hypothetical protein